MTFGNNVICNVFSSSYQPDQTIRKIMLLKNQLSGRNYFSIQNHLKINEVLPSSYYFQIINVSLRKFNKEDYPPVKFET